MVLDTLSTLGWGRDVTSTGPLTAHDRSWPSRAFGDYTRHLTLTPSLYQQFGIDAETIASVATDAARPLEVAAANVTEISNGQPLQGDTTLRLALSPTAQRCSRRIGSGRG